MLELSRSITHLPHTVTGFVDNTLRAITQSHMGASSPTGTAVWVSTVGGFLLGVATTTCLNMLWQSRRHPSIKGRQQQKHDDDGNHAMHNLEEEMPAPRRYGGAIQLSPEKYQRYRELHDNVWDHVLERMYQSNIRNFVIYYHKETSTLYQSFEWIGHWTIHRNNELVSVEAKADEASLFQRDMAAIANDPTTRSWWQECEPCQIPFSQWPTNAKPPSQQLNGSGGGAADWWAPLECVCHTGHWPTTYSAQRRDPDFV